MGVLIKGFKDTTGYEVYEKGYRYVITAGTTQDINIKYTTNVYIEGVRLWCSANAVDTDNVDVIIKDVDNILGYGAGVVLATMAQSKYVRANFEYLRIADSVKLLPSGLYFCLKYYSTGAQDVVVHLDHLLRLTE